MDGNLSADAVEATSRGLNTYIKFLSANDTGLTGGHQSGILVSKSALGMVFDGSQSEDNPSELNPKRSVRIIWQGDLTIDSTVTWYNNRRMGGGTRDEIRITRFGRGFPHLNADETGALLVLTQMASDEFSAFILMSEEEIDDYLTAFGLGPQDAGTVFSPLRGSGVVAPELVEREEIERYVSGLELGYRSDFPPTDVVAARAREIQERVYDHSERLVAQPDDKLVEFTRVEYEIFREMERQAYGPVVGDGFPSVDEFVNLANRVLNRRKSRAGKSLEHHLGAIFYANNLEFEPQVRTEGNKTPDFVFPSGAAYHDMTFPTEKLTVLAAKTTCKDRWRQILTEADRNSAGPHYLVTLQQGNSPKQLEEMRADNVRLIVPKQYINAYPPEFRNDIWTLKRFIDEVKRKEAA